VAHLLKSIQVNRTYPGGLLSADPLQWGRAGLGIVAVNQLNKALNWQPPGWAKALETVAVLHTVLMGFERKHLPHLLLAGGLSASMIAAGQAIDHQADRWLATSPRPEKQKKIIDTGLKVALAAGMLGATLALYPNAYVALTRDKGLLEWIVGKEAAPAIRSSTFEALLNKKGTDVSDEMMKVNVGDPKLPESLKEFKFLDGYIDHHQRAVGSIQGYWEIAHTILEGKLPFTDYAKLCAQVHADELELSHALFTKPLAHGLTDEQHNGIRALLDALDPTVNALGKGTFGEDYQHFETLSETFNRHLPALKAAPADWQHLLMQMPETAEHQASHAPLDAPLVTVLGTEALTALTCRNGCCASALCMGDVAEGVGALVNGASSKAVVQSARSQQDQPSPSSSPPLPSMSGARTASPFQMSGPPLTSVLQPITASV
jgi:hypothetical protein